MIFNPDAATLSFSDQSPIEAFIRLFFDFTEVKSDLREDPVLYKSRLSDDLTESQFSQLYLSLDLCYRPS